MPWRPALGKRGRSARLGQITAALEAIALNSYQLSAARLNSESDKLLVLAGFAHSVARSLARDIHLATVLGAPFVPRSAKRHP